MLECLKDFACRVNAEQNKILRHQHGADAVRLRDRAEGNCDGCFMKSSDALGEMFRRYPERMAWWVEKEATLGTKTMVYGRSYATIQRAARDQGVLPWDDAQSCLEGCGT